LRKEKFPKRRKSKSNPRGDGPFQVLKRVNGNAYKLYFYDDSRVHTTFNITDLFPFAASIGDEANHLNLRTNLFLEGGDDGRPQAKRPTPRAMARRIQEECNSIDLNKAKFLSS